MDQDEAWHAGRPRPWPHCVIRGPSSPSPRRGQTPNFCPIPMAAKRLDDQDATWYGGRPRPKQRYVTRRTTFSLPRTGGRAPPIFEPCLLWPNGWMDLDANWYGDRPRPRPHCAEWGPSSPPKKGHSRQCSAYVYCGQTDGWIRMSIGMVIGVVTL